MLKSLAVPAALALILAACATAPSTADRANATANAKPPAGCVPQTASRIPVKDNSAWCSGFGNTYTQQDINNTGQVFADKALQMLDPSVRTGH
ncbi:MAG TPA: hypothetical protein VGR86_07030 [Steroidobacteraceae bacterium]|nr:hypothetical protein [Steroidobacteraceae bacterium]